MIFVVWFSFQWGAQCGGPRRAVYHGDLPLSPARRRRRPCRFGELFRGCTCSARVARLLLAKDGFAALALLRGALPDLIVTDLKMPNMSGFELLSVVRRRFPQIPTIAISGEFHPPVEPLGVLADGFFAKPFTLEDLLAQVAELLRAGPPRPAVKHDRAPVWVPRNGEYYVITCTDCLRSFSIPAEKSVRVLRELRKLECMFRHGDSGHRGRKTRRQWSSHPPVREGDYDTRRGER